MDMRKSRSRNNVLQIINQGHQQFRSHLLVSIERKTALGMKFDCMIISLIK